MKLYKTIATVAATIMLCISCTDQHFISDENERNTIISDYESRRDTLKYQNIFEDLNKMELSVEQREALMVHLLPAKKCRGAKTFQSGNFATLLYQYVLTTKISIIAEKYFTKN